MNRLVLMAALFVACAHAPEPAPAPAPKAEAVVAPSAPAEIPGEQVLDHRPALPPLAAFDAPVPSVSTLPNGLKLYVVERPRDGIEALGWIVRRGAMVDPENRPGLASLTAAMLEAGSAGKTQAQIARIALSLGAELHATASDDATDVGISAMPSRLGEIATLLSDVALRPNFAPTEWKHVQGEREAQLVDERSQPQSGGSHAWAAAAYGSNPLARPLEGTPESVKAMTLAELKHFYAGFSPKDAAIIAVGGAREADVRREIERAFGSWKPKSVPGDSRKIAASAGLPANPPRLVMVDFPGKPQSVLIVGQPAVPRSSPDVLALRVLNAIVGGSFTSRLNQNLREAHGYSYGAFSHFAFGSGPGPFLAGASVKTDVTGASLRETMGELNHAIATELTESEMSKAKALLAFDLAQALEHAGGAAGAMADIFIYDLPVDEYRTFVSRLSALTAADVQAAAKRHLQPDAMTIAIAGDAKQVLPQLQTEKALALPAPQWRDAGGKPVAK